MSAQQVATGIGLAGLAALFLSVGLPTLMPPEPVTEIEVGAPLEDDYDQLPPTLPGRSGSLDDGDDRDDDPDSDRSGPGSGNLLDSSDDDDLESADPPDDPDDGYDDD